MRNASRSKNLRNASCSKKLRNARHSKYLRNASCSKNLRNARHSKKLGNLQNKHDRGPFIVIRIFLPGASSLSSSSPSILKTSAFFQAKLEFSVTNRFLVNWPGLFWLTWFISPGVTWCTWPRLWHQQISLIHTRRFWRRLTVRWQSWKKWLETTICIHNHRSINPSTRQSQHQ